MTLSQYDKSIETGELQLTFRKKIFHFRIAIFSFFAAISLPAIHLLENLKNDYTTFTFGEIYPIILLFILATLLFRFQKNKLKFKIIKTTLKKEEIIDLLIQLCKEWEWKSYWYEENIFIAKTPTTFSKNIGEQVTVLIHNDNILINTINGSGRRPAFGVMERNMPNKEAIITILERADFIYHN